MYIMNICSIQTITMSELQNSPFCLTCLSTTRNLYPIEDAKFFACLTLLKLADPSQSSLCWECNAYVKKAQLFRQKALKAHVLLSRTRPIPANMVISSLVHKNLKHLVAITGHTPTEEDLVLKNEGLHEDIVVKDEPEDEDCKSTQEDPLANAGMDLEMGQGGPPIDIKEENVALNPLPASKNNQQLIKLIQLPPGPIPSNLKPVPFPPKIIDNITKLPKTKEEEIIVKNTSSKNDVGIMKIPEKKTSKNISVIPIERENKDIQFGSMPTLNERASNALEYIEVQSKCTIRALTEEKRLEVRAKRCEEASQNADRHFCEKCAEFFTTKKSLIDHEKKHEAYCTGDFECKVCGMRFEKEDLQRIHNNTHYRIIICNACTEEFSTYTKFLYHHSMKHAETRLNCKICGLAFTNRALWKAHTRRHNKDKRSECPVCHKMVREDTLKRHIEAHEPRPSLECDVCGRAFNGKVSLYHHKRAVHAQLKAGEAYCAECSLQFKNLCQYQKHLRQSPKHVNQRIQCQECCSEFSCRTYLKAHMERLHSGVDHTCEQCQQVFTSSKALNLHVLKVHKNWEPPKDKICDICGKGFAKKSVLNQHRNGHLNIRPHKCQECDAAFNYTGALHTHIRLKHKKEKRVSKRRKDTDVKYRVLMTDTGIQS